MFHLEVLAERLPLTSIFQNITFIAYVQRLVNVTKVAKFNLPSICFEQKNERYQNFSNEYRYFKLSIKKSLYITWTSFCNEELMSVMSLWR